MKKEHLKSSNFNLQKLHKLNNQKLKIFKIQNLSLKQF
jgi:hypothetical protein